MFFFYYNCFLFYKKFDDSLKHQHVNEINNPNKQKNQTPLKSIIKPIKDINKQQKLGNNLNVLNLVDSKKQPDKQNNNNILDKVDFSKYLVKTHDFEKFLNKLNERVKKRPLPKMNLEKGMHYPYNLKVNIYNKFKMSGRKRKRKIIKIKNLFYTVKRRSIFKYNYFKGFLRLFKRIPRTLKTFMIIRKNSHFSSIIRKRKRRYLSIPKSYKRKTLFSLKKKKIIFY